MPWKCYLVERRSCGYFYLDGELYNPVPGAMWLGAQWRHGKGEGERDSKSLWVMLPGINFFCIDGNYDGATWRRTGEIPNITVTPSINCVGSYHGFIKDGVLTEDTEGRKFASNGKPI